ncbi:hypothetical protein ZWY2020_018538 [Hordeum vulgare]|nr:hypothetical protein ZWY2020_018538 [Hordeum vulgare]
MPPARKGEGAGLGKLDQEDLTEAAEVGASVTDDGDGRPPRPLLPASRDRRLNIPRNAVEGNAGRERESPRRGEARRASRRNLGRRLGGALDLRKEEETETLERKGGRVGEERRVGRWSRDAGGWMVP